MKQQSVVWAFPGKTPPVKFKRNISASNQMIACYCAKFGHVATIPLEDRKMITADWYVNHCLPKVLQARCKRHPRTGVRGLLPHHYNVSAHTAAVTLDFLATSDVQLVTHPPYSPHLAPCGWFFVPFSQKAAEEKAISECPISEHSSKASFWRYPSQRGRMSQTAGLR